jgi:carboxymethylenebutenolidase
MCYDSNAKPPFPAERRGGAQGEDLILTASDGNRFAAFAARPQNPTGAQLVILPDVRGLHQFYKDLALLFAEAGIATIALDYFGRTAGLGPRDDSFEFMPHVMQLTGPGFSADLSATVAQARQSFGAGAPIFTVGFCMGGSWSLIAATGDYGLTGAVAFYAGLRRAFGGNPTVLELAPSIKVPVLGLFGGADQGIPASDVEELDRTLDTTGVKHEIVTYPGAPHSFFDRRWTDFADASADAWKRILAFINTYTPVATSAG